MLLGETDERPWTADMLENAAVVRRDIERDIEVFLLVANRAVGKFVIAAGDPEFIAHRFIVIRLAVSVGIGEPGQFTPLHHDKGT